MAYFEYVCNKCGVYFECIIESDDTPKVFCVECKSKKLSLIGYSQDVPTRVESLQNTLLKLENRIDNLLKKLGEDPNDYDKSRKDDFTYRN